MAILTPEDKDFISKGGGSASSVLGAVGAFILNNHKVLALCLVGLSVVLLLVTVASQVNKKTPITKGTIALMSVAFLILCGFGYLEITRPPATITTVTTDSSKQQQGPNTATSKGNNAPAVAGSGNSVSYGTPVEPSSPARKGKR